MRLHFFLIPWKIKKSMIQFIASDIFKQLVLCRMQQLPCFNSKNCIPTQKNWIFSHIFEGNVFSQRNAPCDSLSALKGANWGFWSRSSRKRWRTEKWKLALFHLCLCSCRASGWSQEPAGAEPDHDHPECALGARWGPSEGVQSYLCSRCWRRWEHGRTILSFLSAVTLNYSPICLIMSETFKPLKTHFKLL